MLSQLLQDVRHAVRVLAKAPLFSALTVCTLALAIGVNTSIFSILSVVLIRPLPIGHSETAGFIYSDNAQAGLQQLPVSPADYLDYRERVDAFERLGAVNRGATFILSGLEVPLWVEGFETTADVFAIWEQDPFLGRTFAPGEDALDAPRVAMLAHGTWERRFGSDPDVVGRVIKLDGYETTIIGVVAPEMEFGSLAEAEVWVPLRLDPATASRTNRSLWVTGRLRAGATIDQARQQVEAVSRSLALEHPEANANWQSRALDMNEALAPPQTWMLLFLLALTVSFVMLIACSNVATLMLARAAARERELAVRAAIGARRGRIVSQLLAESFVLAAAAGILGLAVARVSLMALVWMAGSNSGLEGVFGMVRIDGYVLGFTMLVSAAAPFLFGFLPAWRASRPDLSDALREGTRGSSGSLRGRRALVGTQVALALTLMVVAGLLIKSMIDQRSFDFGLETEGLLTMRIDLPSAVYTEPAAVRQFYADVLERLVVLPAIDGAAFVNARPAANDDILPTVSFLIEGEPIPQPQERPTAVHFTGTPGVIELFEIPLVRGRAFSREDDPASAAVVIINEYGAELFWPGENPLGRRIRFDADDPNEPWREVVGVMGNLNTGNPSAPFVPTIFTPHAQNPGSRMALIARVAGEPLAQADAVRREVWALDAEQPVADVRSMEQVFDDAFAAGETLGSIFVAFAVFAVAMATAGIYGVISFAVAQRTREIGVRMALGARGQGVVGMIVRQALGLVVAGVAVGLVGSFLLVGLLAAAVPNLSPGDPLALGGVAAVFALAASMATYLPARRATRIDPIIALRND